MQHLRLSLTTRLWASYGGRGAPVDRYGFGADRRPAGWVELVEAASGAHLALTGREALRVWLPHGPAWAPPVVTDWTATTAVVRAGGTPPVGTRVVDGHPVGLVPVPLACPELVVHVPTPAELAMDPSVASERRLLLVVAELLDRHGAQDEAGRRTASHKDPRHAREHADVWHDKRLKRFPMPPAHDTRSWRLDDDASLTGWLGRHGLWAPGGWA